MRQARVAALAMLIASSGAGAPHAAPSGYAQALMPHPLQFPHDEGPHPDYRQEWWYLTGNLQSAGGERFGFELTFFRFALAPADARPPGESSPWRTRQVYLGHFAITDVARHRFQFAVRSSRAALGLAGAQADPFRVWIGNWRLGSGGAHEASPPGGAPGPAEAGAAVTAASDSATGRGGAVWRVAAAEKGYVLSLTASPQMPPVLNGDRGLSRKSGEPGDATYYYSIPRVAVLGALVRDGQPLAVHGLAWLDREWGSGGLGPQETGWDWFGLQLGDGSSLMFYSLRDRGGMEDPYSAGTWADAAGRARALSRADVQIEILDHWTDPNGVRYPSRWRLLAPALGLDLTVRPVLADQELVTSPRYWEGAVDVAGTRGGRSITGWGYVELVGYAGTIAGSASRR